MSLRGKPRAAEPPAAQARDKKSGVFGRQKSKRKMHAPPEASSTELAKLLGNRTRALLAFEGGGFDPAAFLDAYLGALSEQAIGNAAQDLGALLATCTEEVESVVTAHHTRFLAACAGVEALEDQVALLRNYTNGLTALVASLKSAVAAKQQQPAPRAGAAAWHQHQQLPFQASPQRGGCGEARGGAMASIEEDMERLLQELDLAIAARDLQGAAAWLRVAPGVGALLDRDASLLGLEVPDFPGWRHSYDAAVGLRKQQLVAALQRQLADANAGVPEIRAATRALSELVGTAPALTAMLNCYSHKIQLSTALLLKQHTAGSDPDSLDFAGGLVQRALLEVAAGGDDLVAIFGVESREPASLFTVWAQREARGVAAVLRRHVLAPAAAASTGLHTTVQVVSLALVLAAMLEASHAISLSATLATELYPPVDSALRRHLKRFTDELRMAATEEVNSLVLGARGAGGGAVRVPPLVSGASLAKEVGMLAELLAPIATPQLAATLRKALTDVFAAATQTISLTLRSHLEGDGAGALAGLLPGVMERLSALIEEGLVSSVAPFAARGGPVLDAKAMDAALGALYSDCTAGAAGRG
ncbi:EXO84A [Scenedesmus sp. PABB004]|nr:EXO84A [Scenedesmus sp. PABB004]